MAPPMPASPIALTVRKALEDKSIRLATDIEFNFLMRIFLDMEKIISLIPRQLDAVEEGLSYVERLVYRLSKNLPRYVTMAWMAEHVYKNIPHLEFRKIDDPTLVLPANPSSIPRGRRGARRPPGEPRTGGPCARQLGYAMQLKDFVDDVQNNKVDLFDCLSQSDIVPIAGYTYDVDDLFPLSDFPGEIVGSCCAFHFGVIRDGLHPPFDFLAGGGTSPSDDVSKSPPPPSTRPSRKKRSAGHSAADRVPLRQLTLDKAVVKTSIVYEGLDRVPSGSFGRWEGKDTSITDYFATSGSAARRT